MDICFWVTNKCNLCCKYCYVDKSKDIMTLDIAERAIKYIIPLLKDNEANNIRFHGGEPLLNKEIIEYIIKELYLQVGNKNMHFYLTTNGTIINGVDFIIENVKISVSIDGTQYYNDLNRIYKNCEGTYSYIDKFIRRMKSKDIHFNIRMTIHPNNVKGFFQNFMHIYNKFKIIPSFAFDYGSDGWVDDNVALFFKQLKNVILYLYDNDPIGAFELVDNLNREYLSRRDYCTGGEKSIHITPLGDLFPCYLSVGNPKYKVGNIYEGLDKKLVQKICLESKKPNSMCMGCGLENNCKSRSCKIINEIYTGNPFKPSGVKCAYTRGIYNLIVELQKSEKIKNEQINSMAAFRNIEDNHIKI